MTGWLMDPLSYGFTVRALLELVLLGITGGVIGCWTVLYRLSYGAESLAHGMLPGLVAASLLGLPLVAGGAAGVLVAGLLIALAARFTPGRPDTAIAVVITTLFGAGVLLALSPRSPAAIQALLFGDPLGIGDLELLVTALAGTAVLLTLWRGHHRFLAVGFDRGAGVGAGVSPTAVRWLLLSLIALTVLIGVRGLGTLLVAAILVAPAAAARLVTDRLGPMFAWSVLFALLSGVAGILVSYHLRLAAGASVALCLVGLYLIVAAVPVRPGRAGHRTEPARPAVEEAAR